MPWPAGVLPHRWSWPTPDALTASVRAGRRRDPRPPVAPSSGTPGPYAAADPRQQRQEQADHSVRTRLLPAVGATTAVPMASRAQRRGRCGGAADLARRSARRCGSTPLQGQCAPCHLTLGDSRTGAVMVRVQVEEDQIVARLPWRLALAAARRTLRVPADQVTAIRVEPSWWRALRGGPGRGCRFRPARWCAGELKHAKGRDFVALIQDEPALVVDLEHWRSPYARLALTVRDPYGQPPRCGSTQGAEYGCVKSRPAPERGGL